VAYEPAWNPVCSSASTATAEATSSALDVLESELKRLHEQMDNLRDEITFNQGSPAYKQLVETLGKLHSELVRRSTEESK